MAVLKNLDQYGNSFQIKVISSLLNDKKFLLNTYDILTPDYFSSQSHKWIIKQILDYHNKYNCPISMEVLKIELQKIDNDVLKTSIKEQLKSAYSISEEDLIYVQAEFSTFAKNQTLKAALLESVDYLQSEDYDSIRVTIDNALKAGNDKDVGHEYNKGIEIRFAEDNRVVVPTPWPVLNDLLQGGLGNGDFGLIFGNPGGGKSWMLVALGAHAINLGYKVVHYTLELGDIYVGRRYDSHLCNIPVDKITKYKDRVEKQIGDIRGNLVIKEYPPKRASIQTIKSHLQKLEELDFIPDLIIIDYVDLLKSPRYSKDRKDEIDDVYLGTKALAKELQTPIWSVSQVNRMGARDKVVEGDKAAGSYDKLMITDFCMSNSRGRKDKVDGTGRGHVMKNRYGGDGMTFNMNIDLSVGKFEFLGEYNPDEEDEDEDFTPQKSFNNEIDNFDKKHLREKFFQLQNSK